MKTLQELRKHEDNKIFSCVNNIIELAFGTHLISDNAETALPVIQYYRKILGIAFGTHFISDDIEKALSAIQYFNKILRISK
eukprot:gene1750-1858_t